VSAIPSDGNSPLTSFLLQLDLFAESPKDLKLDSIFRSAGGASHPNQVIHARNEDCFAISLDLLGVRSQVVVSVRTGRRSENVDWPKVRRERERIAVAERMSIWLKGKTRFSAPKLGVDLA
jgi:hypothetical protein